MKRLPTEEFDRDVTSVAMDERFVLVGQVNGKLAAVYLKNGNIAFSTKISDNAITAVCCEEQDEADNPIFYAGDEEGNLFTDFRKGNFSGSSANYSLDGDGTFMRKKGAGDYKVIQYDSRTPNRVVATCALEFGKKKDDLEEVMAYAVVDEEYENLIEEGTAAKSLQVFNSSSKLLRELEFNSPVKQVMSCRHHEGEAKADIIYILLWNGALYKVTGSQLMDTAVENDKLDLKIAVTKPSDNDGDDDSDDDDEGEYGGFCVFGKKLCIYGNDGLYTADTTA